MVRANSGRWHSETPLRLIDDFHVHVRNGGNTVELRAGGQVFRTVRSGLATLAVFPEAANDDRGAGGVEAGDGQQPGLVRYGKLHRAPGSRRVPDRRGCAGGRGDGYGAVKAYVGLLEDRRRTESFLAGVKAVVRPGDVVLDLGTGIGLLAIAAAQAGASRVYALEPTGIGTLAKANFDANGYGDRITLITGSFLWTCPRSASTHGRSGTSGALACCP